MAAGERGEANVMHDDSRADAVQRAAVDANTALDGNPGKLAHDLRNFLAPIQNAVQVLKIRAQTDPGLQQLADMIERQVVGIKKRIDAINPATSRARPAPPQETPAPARANAGVRLLIVDDNTAFRESLGAVLRDLGHLTREAADGMEALTIARAWSPQLIFLDINMPEINGYELARRFRTEFPTSNMKLVMLSGDSLSEAATRAAQASGFDYCMDKLSSVEAFRAFLDTLVTQTA